MSPGDPNPTREPSARCPLEAPETWIPNAEPLPLVTHLACPITGQSLRRAGDQLVTEDGRHAYPIVRGVPRFVPSDNYAKSFSFEWNVHDRTQLDTYRADSSSEEMFIQKTGLRPDDVRGKLVLDAGIGAGRFTDVLVRWGARVIGVDLSYSVEAAQRNFGHLPNVLVCQADIGRLPFRPGAFDFIIAIGVLHHTPDTRKYFSNLPKLLRPGGEIAIWVYPNEGSYATRAQWIPFTSRIPSKWYYRFCRVFVPWALERRGTPLVDFIQQVFPFSDQRLGIENDILDTFDGYSPRYHGIHSPDEVEQWFRETGLTDIRRFDWHTAARGRQPVSPSTDCS